MRLGRPGSRWSISPALPLTANVLLAVLWLCSAYGGWGNAAFCDAQTAATDARCLHDFAFVMKLSLIPALPAVLISLAGLFFLRDDPDALDVLLVRTALLWVGAVALLLVGGYLVQ